MNGLGASPRGATEAKVGAVAMVSRSLDQVHYGRRDETQRCVHVSSTHTSSPCTLPGSRSLLFHCGAFTEHLVLTRDCPARSPFLKKLSVYPGRQIGKPGVRARGPLRAMQPRGWSQPHAPGQESLAPSGETLLAPFLTFELTGRAWSMHRPTDPTLCQSGWPAT